MLWVCVCSLRYPACYAYAPYCHLWPAPLYSIFPHYLIHGTIFGKRLLNPKCVFWFSVLLLSVTFLILRRTESEMIRKCTYIGLHVQCQFLSDINERGIFPTEFRKILNYRISWKSDQWEPSCYMRTDGLTHDDDNSSFSRFCERAEKFYFLPTQCIYVSCRTNSDYFPIQH